MFNETGNSRWGWASLARASARASARPAPDSTSACTGAPPCAGACSPSGRISAGTRRRASSASPAAIQASTAAEGDSARSCGAKV